MTLSRQRSTQIAKVMLTVVLAGLGALVLWHLYDYSTYARQTRDGRVRADVVPLAADVTGRVTSVYVRDNQPVRRGQLLFVVDRERLVNAVARADATVGTAKASLIAAEREDRRYRNLVGVVSSQDIDTRRSAAESARAAYDQARADRDLAKINLSRAEVRAPVNGIITNFSLRPGAYANASTPVMAIVDTDSFYIAGYFEETKLAQIRAGSPVTIRMMGDARPIRGHVSGLAAGIDDRERTTAPGTLLANVNPTFSWIRLAQRVPVRIAIDKIPPGLALIAGRTVTVSLDNAADVLAPGRQL